LLGGALSRIRTALTKESRSGLALRCDSLDYGLEGVHRVDSAAPPGVVHHKVGVACCTEALTLLEGGHHLKVVLVVPPPVLGALFHVGGAAQAKRNERRFAIETAGVQRHCRRDGWRKESPLKETKLWWANVRGWCASIVVGRVDHLQRSFELENCP
jgi:hypothetical protein